MGWVNLAPVLARGGLDTISAGAGLSRGIAFGSYALYEDIMRDVEAQQEGYRGQTEVIVDVDLNEKKLAATTAFAGTMTTAAYMWVVKKMVLRERAQFISNVGDELIALLTELIEGSRRTTVKWGMGGYGGLTSVRGKALTIQKKVAEGGDIADLLIDLMAFKRESELLESLYRSFNDTFITLQYANNLGGGMLYIDPDTGKLIGHADAVLSLDDVTRLQKIANSQTVFGRVQTIGAEIRVGGSKFRPFANKDIATLAQMFIPDRRMADDVFDLARELKGFDTFFGELSDELTRLRASITNSIRTAQNIIESDPLGTDARARNTARRIIGIQAEDALQVTAGIGDEIQRLQRVEEVFQSKVATATKVSDGWINRWVSAGVGKAAYAGLRTATGFRLSKEVSESWAQRVASATKVSGRFLGKIFLIDTVVWAATGVFDLLFIDDDAEYENAVLNYFAEEWGFTPIGFLVDKAVDAVLTEEAQDAALQNLRATMATAIVESENLQALVNALVTFYEVEFKITIFPADFYIEQGATSVAVADYIIGLDPLDILSVALVACVAKIVFNGWVRPAYNALIGQAGV